MNNTYEVQLTSKGWYIISLVGSMTKSNNKTPYIALVNSPQTIFYMPFLILTAIINITSQAILFGFPLKGCRGNAMREANYCSSCGRKLVFKTLLDGSRERYCPKCDLVFFDTPSPAVIVAVTNADRVLLTRSVSWKHSYWGLIAGHVKSGETAEDAAIREVREEVGLEISDLKLLKTYSFIDHALKTHILTMGFTAEVKGIRIRKCKELEKAAWFSLHAPLPLRPNAIATQVVKEIFPKIRLIDLEKND